MTNSSLRNTIKAQMSKPSLTSIKHYMLPKRLPNDDASKSAIRKIPDKSTIREPSLPCNPSRKGMASASRNENMKVRDKTAKGQTSQKIDSFPRIKAKDNKTMNGLYNTLIQINHTDLMRSPYFGSLSKVLRGKNFNRERLVKTQKLDDSKKLPALKNCLNKRRISTASMKSNKAVQTTVTSSKSENLVAKNECTTNGKSTNGKNEYAKCSVTKFPIVAEKRENLKQKPSNTNFKASEKVKLPQSSKVNVQKGNTNQRSTPTRYLGYWDNEIRNYYNWTSFCLMRRYRSDTKMLKEQLKNLGREGCSINDVIWKEAESFRKNIEKDRKKLDEVLKITTKDKPFSTRKKRCTNKKLGSKNSDSVPVIRTPGRKGCVALVPPPSASESLFVYRKQERPPSSPLSQRREDSADKQLSRSVSDHSIFPGGNSGTFVCKGLQYRSQVSDTSFDTTETNNTASLNEQKSKFKSKFTLKSERLSFEHLKKAVR